MGDCLLSRLHEFQELFHQIQIAWEKDEQTVLVILTDVKGSAYRLPGTKMLMTSGGTMVGTISGGCLEADLYEWATKVFENRKPMTLKYDLSDTEIWSLGIGCKGDLEILFLPIFPQDGTWKKVEKHLANEESFTLIIEMENGQTKVLQEMNSKLHNDTNLPIELIEYAEAIYMKQTRAEVIEHQNKRYYMDVVKPSERLIVAGAGKDAVPLVELAYKAGFSVTVLDTRSNLNNLQHFPHAKHITSAIENLSDSQLNHSWWLIMNHHMEKDEVSLKYAIESNPRYIGVLGPIYRTNEMLNNIGYSINSAPIHSPVGLDLGAESMDEVAISIISELMCLRADRTPQYLHGKGKIHV